MRRIAQRIRRLEREVESALNPLTQIRRDLKPIIEIKRVMDVQNCYNNKPNPFFKSTKEECIKEGVATIKKIIIELADKYRSEGGEA